jgi:predicted  nucleic acid-binding Zn-ribbon protein
LQEVPPQTSQILNFLKNKKNQENRELNFVGYEQSFHELQIRVQDLKKILSNKEDEIMELRNEKEKDNKRINFLENDVFNLRA